jgi:hypothetical protein
MNPDLEIIAGAEADAILSDPSPEDFRICSDEIIPLVRQLRAKGLPFNAIIAALASAATATIDKSVVN